MAKRTFDEEGKLMGRNMLGWDPADRMTTPRSTEPAQMLSVGSN
jgi:hypothetical protein